MKTKSTKKMKEEKVGNNIKLIIIIIILFLIDRISKYILNNNLEEKVNLIPKILWLTPVKNTGAAFGILKGNVVILGTLTLIASIIILYLILFKKNPINIKISLSLIAAGALGNTVDRIFSGHVFDFIDLGWWPVFNIADILICIGAALIVYFIFLEKNYTHKKNE
ncbi:MAG: signal peptidase II [Nanobdellota archaeon]